MRAPSAVFPDPDAPFECASGEVLNASGECVPFERIECGEGTLEEEGQCVPNPEAIVSCGAGTVAVANRCLSTLEALRVQSHSQAREPDDPNFAAGNPNLLTLAAAGDSVLVHGVIDAPEDIDSDGDLDQDFDWFAFEAEAGTLLEISIANDGLPAPFFAVLGVGEASFFSRQSAINRDNAPRRQVYLPVSGTYLVAVTDQVAVNGGLIGAPLSGSPSFGYFLIIETLPPLTPKNVDYDTPIATPLEELATNGLAFVGVAGAHFARLAASQADSSYGAVLTVLDSDLQFVAELELAAEGTRPLALADAGLVLLPDWKQATGFATEPDIELQLTALAPASLPLSLDTELAAGASQWVAFDANASSLIEFGAAADASSSVRPLLRLYDDELRPMVEISDQDEALGQWFFEAAQPVLLELRNQGAEGSGDQSCGLNVASHEAIALAAITQATPHSSASSTLLPEGGAAWFVIEQGLSQPGSLDLEIAPEGQAQLQVDCIALYPERDAATSYRPLESTSASALGEVLSAELRALAEPSWLLVRAMATVGTSAVNLSADYVPFPSFEAPAGESCAAPIEWPAQSGSYLVDILSYGNDYSGMGDCFDPQFGASPGPDAFFSLRVPGEAVVELAVDQVGSGILDPTLALYPEGSCALLADGCLVADDVIGAVAVSWVNPSESEQEVLIYVDNWLSATPASEGDALIIDAQLTQPSCGDGQVEGLEACDDGESEGGDGCTACTIDEGYSCVGAPSFCIPTPQGDSCGDVLELSASSYTLDWGFFSNQLSASCLGQAYAGPDLVFRVELEADELFAVSATAPAGADVAFVVSTSCEGTASCIAGVDEMGEGEGERLEFTAPAAGEYFIALESHVGTSTGHFQLEIE